jgi:predicted Zn-dependent protease
MPDESRSCGTAIRGFINYLKKYNREPWNREPDNLSSYIKWIYNLLIIRYTYQIIVKKRNEIKILFIDLMRIIKWALSVLLLFVVSCAVNPVTGERELMLVSEEQELRIGRESAPSLKWEFGGLYRDNSLEDYLEEITKRLWQNSERPHLPVRFQIQNTSVPNAFALPGYVAITRGLLSGLENEAQFAAVIGHEIGHVMARHTAQRLSRLRLQQLGLAIGGAALVRLKARAEATRF